MRSAEAIERCAPRTSPETGVRRHDLGRLTGGTTPFARCGHELAVVFALVLEPASSCGRGFDLTRGRRGNRRLHVCDD